MRLLGTQSLELVLKGTNIVAVLRSKIQYRSNNLQILHLLLTSH